MVVGLLLSEWNVDVELLSLRQLIRRTIRNMMACVALYHARIVGVS